ncbi:MAG: hypothetical protein ACRD2U_06785 [Terriglobales bacterium]
MALCLAITAVVQAQSSIGQVGPHAVPQKSSLLARRQAKSAIYRPINQRQRIRWFITSTIGPSHLFGSGTFSAAFGTALDRPKAYGPGWGGFADRFGMRLTGISTGNAMEAGIGALWGEDPRYFPIPDQPFKARVWNAVMKTFEARRRSGNYAPAYARYIAVTGNNFLSNTWREHSEANVQDAIIRTAEGFAGRMAANAWGEFWPDLKLRVVKRKK